MPEPRDAEAERDLLVRAAEEAGVVAMAHFRTPVRKWEKDGGQGPVSEADLAVNARLAERLRAARPTYGWLSEEDPDTPARLGAERVFVVDPIDGTRAYLKGDTGWAVALAVVEAGRPVAGVVHLPARGETYAAHLGGGARLGQGAIAVSGRDRLDGARAVGGKAILKPEHWQGAVPQLETEFSPALAWRLCRVAAGDYDLTATFTSAWEWDVAAGALIAAEAGAAISDGGGGRLVFNSRSARTPGVIAAAPAVHAELIARRRR